MLVLECSDSLPYTIQVELVEVSLSKYPRLGITKKIFDVLIRL